MTTGNFQRFIDNNVEFIDINRVTISDEVEIGEGTVIYPNVTLLGKTKIGKNCKILPNCFFENAIIDDEVMIDSSKIMDSEVKRGSTVGPFAHLRMNTVVYENCRIGNFVEFKNCKFGKDSRCAHLTYLGDCEVGEDVNIGCGVVTCNYDGKVKSKTIIGNHVFVGSNVNLIAPVTIGDDVLLAAGSTITKDVETGAMGIARSRQTNKEDYGNKFFNK